jgi:hypothetical protein
MHKSSFMPMVLGYIPRSEGYIPLFFQGTIVLGTVVLESFKEIIIDQPGIERNLYVFLRMYHHFLAVVTK